MAGTLLGMYSWRGRSDPQGFRYYDVWWRIRSEYQDGPLEILSTAGLPIPGSIYDFSFTNAVDYDPWAYCTWEMSAEFFGQEDGAKCNQWMVEQHFTTKPQGGFCTADAQTDPLLQPMKIGGDFRSEQVEVFYNYDGTQIVNSSHEPVRGVFFDESFPSVNVEQNVADLELPLVSSMVNTVNNAPLWGVAARCVRFSDFSWEQRYHGNCYAYYVRRMKFDVDYRTFDWTGTRAVIDEGTKLLKGYWQETSSGSTIWNYITYPGADPDNKKHFVRALDPKGIPTRYILNGAGVPAETDEQAGRIEVQKYPETNFFLLDIPITL